MVMVFSLNYNTAPISCKDKVIQQLWALRRIFHNVWAQVHPFAYGIINEGELNFSHLFCFKGALEVPHDSGTALFTMGM